MRRPRMWNGLRDKTVAKKGVRQSTTLKGRPIGEAAADPWVDAANNVELAAFRGQGAKHT